MEPCLVKNKIYFYLILATLCLWRSSVFAEPIAGQIAQVQIAENGRYVIASYTGPYVVVWDLDRLWDYLQPIQVHRFVGSARFSTNSMPIAASINNGRLASKNSESPMVAVCKLAAGFPCRFRIPVAEKYCGLVLAPDGRRLLIITRDEIQRVDLAAKVIIRDRIRYQSSSFEYLNVDWQHGLVAIKANQDSITIASLEDFRIVTRLAIATEHIRQAVFSESGNHLIVSYEHWQDERDRPDRWVRSFDVSSSQSPSIQPVDLKEADYLVPGDSEGEYWSVVNWLGDEWKLALLSPTGELTKRHFFIRMERESEIIAVCERRNYILIQRGNVLDLWDLRIRLPIMQMHDDVVGYRTSDGYLPHLPSRMGAAPVFELLEKRSLEYRNERKPILWWLASLATKLKTRYDRGWFSLLIELQKDKEIGREYLLLHEMMQVLLQLNKADFLLNAGQPEAALKIVEHGLQLVQAHKNDRDGVPDLNIYDQNMAALAANYRLVLERDLLLQQGQSASTSGKVKIAENAYRKALEIDPEEWRAYSGLLSLHLKSDSTTFDSILKEAQQALRLKDWNEQRYPADPGPFFKERALNSIRAQRSN